MKFFSSSLYCVFILLLFFRAGGIVIYGQYETISIHNIEVHHKGVKDNGGVGTRLYEVVERASKKKLFYTDVESVICGSSVCKIVVIRLFWNVFGKFQKFELADGIHLEKEDGINFEAEDYLILHDVLKNENSILKNYFKEQLVKKAVNNAFDALSGATISLGKDEVVEGAVWTCYTLWHWANGEIVSLIRDITARKKTAKDFITFLDCGSNTQQLFAIEYLTKNKFFSLKAMDAVFNANYQNSNLYDASFNYFEKSGNDSYRKYIYSIYINGNRNLKFLALKNIYDSSYIFPTTFYESLSQKMNVNIPYSEFDLFLKILERNNISSSTINKFVINMLSNVNFILARRAYWYLNNKELPNQGKEALMNFRNKYENSL